MRALARVPSAAVIAALLGVAGSLAGQTPPERPAPAEPLPRNGFAERAEISRPWSSMVAVTLLVPRGSADDPPGAEGAAWLLAEVTRRSVEAALEPGTAVVSADVTRSHTLFTALAEPTRWARTRDALLSGVFSNAADPAVIDAEMADVADAFMFERGAPVRQFEAEFDSLVFDRHAGRRHDPHGTLESIGGISASGLRDLARRIYQRGESILVVTGPLAPEPSVRSSLDPPSPPEPAASDSAAVADTVGGGTAASAEPVTREPAAEAAPPTIAWRSGARRVLGAEVTSSWIGAAFPVPSDVPRTVLEFIVRRAHEELNPDPPDPGLFGSSVAIEEHPDGPLIMIRIAVLPEAQGRWEMRAVDAVRGMAERYADVGFFRWHRRRFRGTRLVEEGAPEALGSRAAFDLLRGRNIRDLAADIEGLDPRMLAEAIGALGEPRVLVFGPMFGAGPVGPGRP